MRGAFAVSLGLLCACGGETIAPCPDARPHDAAPLDLAPRPDTKPDQRLDTRPDLLPDLRVDALPPDHGAICSKPLPDAGAMRDGCPVPKPTAPDLLDNALGKAGLDRCKASFAGFDPAVYALIYPADPYRLPFFERTHRYALEGPRFARALTAALDAATVGDRPVAHALMVAAHHAGFGGETCLPPSDPGGQHPLARALARLIDGAGGKADVPALEREAATVPFGLQQALVPIVDALAGAALARADALKGADIGVPGSSDGVTPEMIFDYAASPALDAPSGLMLDPTLGWVQNVFRGGAKGFKVQHLYAAAVRLATAIERAKLERFAGTAVFLTVTTPLGRIVLRGPDDTTYDPKDPALAGNLAFVLDTGGNDTYRIPAGANAAFDNPVSVLIDLAGADAYGYVEVPSPLDGPRLPSDSWGRAKPNDPSKGDGPISLSDAARQGAGRMGIGMLFDLGAGDDRYTSLRLSQGFGALGVGVLYDAGGDDIYRGEAGLQGAGIFGVGLLLDAAGNDRYEAYTQAQGYAYVKGVGLLYDATGDDQYLADLGDPAQGGDPLYYSPQLPGGANSSLVQGAAWGRRADLTDKQSMAGGLGLLRDKAGHDRYRASVYGQGTGYWYGTGILADAAGNDSYDGLYYVQGSAAHYALAVFLDDAGNDRYNGDLKPRATSIGVGHDASVGWHLDLGGDDTYRAPYLSLGAGNDNGQGFLVNRGGHDTYFTVGTTSLGAAPQSATTGWRPKAMTLGIFLDAEGADRYFNEGKPLERNDQSWAYPASTPPASLGVGLDGKGQVLLP